MAESQSKCYAAWCIIKGKVRPTDEAATNQTTSQPRVSVEAASRIMPGSRVLCDSEKPPVICHAKST